MNLIRLIALFFVAISVAGTAAWAGQCQDDVDKIEKALSSKELDADTRAQAEDMRSQAVQLCGAGNEEEGLAVTAEVKALLHIDN
jgi:hypothetical protein